MSADYLISSLPAVPLDGPAPMTTDAFLAACRDQLSARDAAGVAALVADAPSDHPVVRAWRDLDTQLRNTVAGERARILGTDAAKWRHTADGCSLYWTNRAAAAFQEKDPAKRERLIDQLRFDAAGDLTPVESPLSAAAAFTYAVRLQIALRRAKIAATAGNNVFNRLTEASTAPREANASKE